MKKDPRGVFFGVFKLSKHENTNKHVLVQARKIHESVTLSSIILSPLFKLVKNEERLELTFLDSLKFNRNDKEEVFFLGYKWWQHVLLEHNTL